VELGDLRDRIESILSDSQTRAVILVDDIDRLDRREIHALFQLVKHSAGFENTTYVLAFDDDMVAAALGERYGSGDPEAGRSFLEKIVQVPLHLPPADSTALRKLALEGVDAALRLAEIELSDDDVRQFVRLFDDGIGPRLSTPRQAIRYANALEFALPILKEEVNAVDQLIIEAVRVFYPLLYDVIRRNPDAFTGGELATLDRDEKAKERAQEVVDGGLSDLPSDDAEEVKRMLMELFPRLKGIYRNYVFTADSDRRWEAEQRVCSSRYFLRYFHYGLPHGDIADQDIQAFVETAQAGDEEKLTELLAGFSTKATLPRLIEKLRRWEREIQPGAAQCLALAISHNADLLPREEGPFGIAYFDVLTGGHPGAKVGRACAHWRGARWDGTKDYL